MQLKHIGIIIVVLLIVIGGYLFLRESYQAPTPVPTQTPTVAPKETGTTQAPTTGVTEVSVVGTEFNFSPANISVKTGEKVKITFKNNGKTSHNLILEGLGIETKTIGVGQTDVVEFTAPSSGTYKFFCSVPGHRVSGMEGQLKVQ